MRWTPLWTLGLLGIAVLLQGCGHGQGRLKLDSATNACRTQPAYCAQAAGQESILPRAIRAVGTAGGSAVAAAKLLDEAQLEQVSEALKECADKARTEVILEHFGTRSPTREECLEVGTDKKRKTLTRAMILGEEMHRVALSCAAEKLNELRPGEFSLEPTYQYDLESEETTWLSPDQVDGIRRDGNFFDLKGSLVPDVVLHEGHPMKIQAAFDFKFPCIDISDWPKWRDYPRGHPYEGSSQRDMYIKAFRTRSVFRVSPWLGVGP
ncbi:hypothetical protein D7Y13_15975 [Corallococcus praedator]|uniref:Lipoprotein n=1 Tax=Corallococcus praedator TaxID=2316724 RepID=A0ABX9QHQ0_9BACT|nr:MULTISPECIES: hypothetical protein [Corallococcus]RKH14469.1 hypothetical protein D7X74_20060 [Corallococcus sp. CA047B]RKH28830.1 hypothetical protein D7X75_23915 [Corallococcus sp. CA031C]RKI08423.1 hypothetical protein D7Y13_15975 [Corallococcus praedator]